jgi:Secretion system C-terminal sorting domain
MKKILLLLVVSLSTLAANSQQMQSGSIVLANGNHGSVAAPHSKLKQPNAKDVGDRTTSGGGGRWYSYMGYLVHWLGSDHLGNVAVPLWNDTTAIFDYTAGPFGHLPGYAYNEWTSLGMSLDPFFSGFNNPSLYPGEIYLTTADTYSIDSMAVWGDYRRNPANTATDELRIALVYGNGAETSNLPLFYYTGTLVDYGVDTLYYIGMLHDSLHNQAGPNLGGPTVVATNISWNVGDTFTNARRAFAVGPMVVPASGTTLGNYSAVSVGFKNGAAGYPFGDTVEYISGSMKYDDFFMRIFYEADSTGAPVFPTHAVLDTDQNLGYFKREGVNDSEWGGYYVPTWGYNSDIASQFQFPYVDFYVSCATCGVLGLENVNKNGVVSVHIYPNPATTQLNIDFHYSNPANVEVVLTDMLANRVANRLFEHVAEGSVVFDTQGLAPGMYLYSLQTSDGIRNTGHVAVVH